jgi:hypothetical protein
MRLRIGIISIGLFLCIGFLSWLSHQSFARITSIELHGGVLVTQPDVQSRVQSIISGSYLWLFPKDTILLYPRAQIEKVLRADLQRIKTIDVHVEKSGVLFVYITERTPVAQWCDSALSVGTTTDASANSHDEQCYFMDDHSTIFAEAPSFSGDAYFKYYGARATTTSPIGSMFMSSTTEFEKISHFVERVRGIGLRPQYIVADSSHGYSLTISGGGKILFTSEGSIDVVFENLQVILRTPELAPRSSQDIPVEYIDLRYGNKVFYKLKQ